MRLVFIALAIVLSHSAFSKELKFEFSAGYNWGETVDVASDAVFGRSGLITGSWQWRFANGRKGNTHFRSATAFRSQPYSLAGTIELFMWELEGSAAGQDVLYVAYDGVSFDPKTGTTKVEAKIVGGKGLYAGASGHLKWSATNGFIERGTGLLIVK